jgi:aminoglycoside 6'-N-acetyltransferase I
MTSRRIVNLEASDPARIAFISQFLFECFRKYAPTWLPDNAACLKQIFGSLEPGRHSRVMLDENAEPIGWIGAITDSDTWEIHPLAVSPHHQQKGVGRLLVADIEDLARASGAVSVWAGTSDETNSTSFSRFDLYKEPERSFDNIEAPGDHPVNFWLKVGYSLVGVLPDEEGLGKPGIHFAKRVV